MIGGVLVVLLGAGWFALSRGVMGRPAPDAVAETVGVMLALLVAASVIGAVARSKGSHG